MPKIFKIAGYFGLFIFAYFIFLYWTFPYNILKERLVDAVEQQLGSAYDVKIGDFSPSFFTGAVLKNVEIVQHDGDKSSTVWKASKVRVRASLGSVLFGGTNVSFSIKNPDTVFSGSFKKSDEGFSVNGEFDDFNIADLGFIGSSAGLDISSKIDGTIKLNINSKNMIQSVAAINIALNDIKVKAGKLSLGAWGTFDVPELIISKGSGSGIELDLSRNVAKIKKLKLEGGDFQMDVTGDVYVGPILKNYRVNLKGNISVSPKLENVIKFTTTGQGSGSPIPIVLTGRLGQPSIKIGDMELPGISF